MVGCRRRSFISIDNLLVVRLASSRDFVKLRKPSPFITSNARPSRAQNSVQASIIDNLIFLGRMIVLKKNKSREQFFDKKT